MDTREFFVLESGNTSVVLAGVAAVVLSIIGLAGILPIVLVSAGAIAMGISLLLAGMATAAERKKILDQTRGSKLTSSGIFTFALSIETLAGVTSIILGILSLLKMKPDILLGADAIVLGVAFMAMCAADARENEANLEGAVTEKQKASYKAAKAAIDLQFLTGVGSITLGILALIGLAPVTLILVAFLADGFSLAIKGTTLDIRLYEEKKESQPQPATPPQSSGKKAPSKKQSSASSTSAASKS